MNFSVTFYSPRLITAEKMIKTINFYNFLVFLFCSVFFLYFFRLFFAWKPADKFPWEAEKILFHCSWKTLTLCCYLFLFDSVSFLCEFFGLLDWILYGKGEEKNTSYFGRKFCRRNCLNVAQKEVETTISFLLANKYKIY